MTIDWFTVIAQAINFVILLWLMKRFLFKPILHAIDEREKRIAEELESAKADKAAAKKQKEEYDLKKKDLDQQSGAFLKSAQEEGQAERLRLLKEAREAAEALTAKRKAALAEDEKSARQAISRRTQDEVLTIARKVLADLAGATLEERVVAVFNQRLHDLDEAETQNLISTLEKLPGEVTVHTGLDISQELQDSTKASIKEVVGAQTKVKFETAPDLISGIELSVNGQKVAWSVADYLSSIEKGIDDIWQEQSS